MNGYYDEVIAVLKKHGFSFSRHGKGSHQLWAKDKTTVESRRHISLKLRNPAAFVYLFVNIAILPSNVRIGFDC